MPPGVAPFVAPTTIAVNTTGVPSVALGVIVAIAPVDAPVALLDIVKVVVEGMDKIVPETL